MFGLPLELMIILALIALGLSVYFVRKARFSIKIDAAKKFPWKLLLTGVAIVLSVVFVVTYKDSINQQTESWFNTPILAVVLSNYGWLGLFLVIIGIYWAKQKWLQSIGWILILLAIFFSGYADWARDTIAHGGVVLSCNTDPSQSKCEQLKERQEAQAERELEELISRVELRAKLEAVVQEARAAAKPELTEAPPGEECSGVFADLKGCESIVFGRNEKRDHEPPIGFCSVGDGPITGAALGSSGIMRWTPNGENVRGRVFFLRAGESFGGFTCR